MPEELSSRAPRVQSGAERLDALVSLVRNERRRIAVVLAVVAVLVAALWWLLRTPAAAGTEVVLPQATTSLAAPGAAAGGSGAAGGGGAGAPVAEVVVHVAGAVARPGVLRVPAGGRVIDAVDAAGGLTLDADAARVNLAAKLSDGQRVFVPRAGEAPPAEVGSAAAGASGSGGSSGDSGAPVDLNTADARELESLPGVGPATAAAIIEHRTQRGPFRSVDDLRSVRGIGDAKFAQLRSRITV
jgi:competence protein ComEA